MTQKSTQKLRAFPCSNPSCDNEVQPRRPSASGDHWCPAPDCQAMKQRQIRAARRAEKQNGTTVEDERMALVYAAIHKPRRTCVSCGLEDAVDGFMHRSLVGRGACDGTGGRGRAAGAAWIDLIHPDLAPKRE